MQSEGLKRLTAQANMINDNSGDSYEKGSQIENGGQRHEKRI